MNASELHQKSRSRKALNIVKDPSWRSSLAAVMVVLAYLGIFVIVFGAKLIVVSRYTVPDPYWDSWHVEGLETYKPFLLGHYSVANLFEPVSEHRPAVLRLYALALLKFNREWDVQLQMVGTAALFGILGCLLFAFLRGSLPPLLACLLALYVALILSLPIGWENTVNGHHAGWFFFYIFTVITLWFCVGQAPLGGRWWLGFANAALAYLSLFAGVLTPLAAAAGMALVLLWDRRFLGRKVAGILALAALFGAGMAWENRFPGQENVKARDLLSFLKALGYALVWPSAEITVMAFLAWAPVVVAIVLIARGRWKLNRPLLFLLSLVFWIILQCVGMAYARGMNGIPPMPRYLDIPSFGLLVNFALLLMLVESASTRTWSALAAAFAIIWIWTTGYSLKTSMDVALKYSLPAKAADSLAEDKLLRAYVATRDRGYIANASPAQLGYYGGADGVAAVTDDPVLRRILPYGIREPMPVSWPAGVRNVGVDNLPPGFPVLRDSGIVSTFAKNGATVEMMSEDIPAPVFPYLEMRVAGDFTGRGISLRLVSETGESIRVRPSQPADHDWISVITPAPKAPFRISASDTDSHAWLAFSPPREVGRESAWARFVLGLASSIYVSGLILMGSLLVLASVLSVASR
jgi:ABC-type amino acid transport system permease subunit